MICPGFSDPNYLLFIEDVPSLLYYSHIPTMIISLLIGFFVFLKDRKSLIGKILLLISIIFSLWVLFNLVLWTNNGSDVIIFFWSFFGILYVLLSVLFIYFAHIFIGKKDISLALKILLGLIVSPIVFLTPTIYNLNVFNLDACGIYEEGIFFTRYYYLVGFVAFFWILIYGIYKYRKEKTDFKKQIFFLTLGIELFLLSFFTSGFLASYLVEKGIIADFGLEQYGLFGMTIFMGFLAYLIVKFKAFHIKVLATQALVVALVILIGSEYFFAESATNVVLIGITLILSIGFGYFLIKSVKQEVERKEQLQRMADSLAIANDKLKQLDQAKTDFINIASHQLKHAPTPIKGYLSLLLDGTYGEISENQKGVLEKLNDANNRQIHLVDDLLAVARMESGKVQLDFQKENIEDICQGVYNNLAVTAKEKSLEFKYEKSEQPLPALMLDKSKMFEAIFNFVDNAVKYTPSGSVILKTELAQTSNYKPRKDRDDQKPEIAGPVVRVTVADTGTGISDENISHLFAKFSRKDVAKVNSDGTGLGLYVVKLMIEAHGGRTWAQSEGEGKGSQFIIEIPVEGK